MFTTFAALRYPEFCFVIETNSSSLNTRSPDSPISSDSICGEAYPLVNEDVLGWKSLNLFVQKYESSNGCYLAASDILIGRSV